MKRNRRTRPDSISQTIALISVLFGMIALVLTCVGVATPNWYVKYGSDANNTLYYQASAANLFYSCTYNTDGKLNACIKRQDYSYMYPSFAQIDWIDGYFRRIGGAGALCIVGIILLAFGVIATLIMTLTYLPLWMNFLPPGLLFLANLFMVAGMSEGSNFLLYNGYSVILYQSGHVVTIFTLCTSALAAGRNHFARWTEAHINTTPLKLPPVPT